MRGRYGVSSKFHNDRRFCTLLIYALCFDICHTCRLAEIEPSTRPPSQEIGTTPRCPPLVLTFCLDDPILPREKEKGPAPAEIHLSSPQRRCHRLAGVARPSLRVANGVPHPYHAHFRSSSSLCTVSYHHRLGIPPTTRPGPGKRIEQWFLDARFLHFQPNIFEQNQTKLPSQFIIQNHWYDPSGTDRVDYIPEAMKSRGKWERYPESEIYDHENAGYWPPEDPTDISDLLTSVLPEGKVILDWGAAKTVLRESTVGLEVDLTENIPRSSIPSFGFSSTCIQYPLMTARCNATFLSSAEICCLSDCEGWGR
ncbi:hypothetical protein F5888DRAFT_1174165 [Russula emetica]|nr:hypothetical protein F5888DRAFT_1174165 [Russula emetica]